MEKRLETRGPKDCSLGNLISNNSFKDFVAGDRVNNKSSNSYELALMGILECQWGYQFLDGIFDETHEVSGVMEYWMGFWETKWGCSGVGQKPIGLPEKSMGFTFNGAVRGGSQMVLIWKLYLGVFSVEKI